MTWFTDSLLKAHILYVSPDWVLDRGERFDGPDMVRVLKDAGISAAELYCKDVHGINYYPTKLGVGEPYPRDIVGELYDACHAAGVKLIAYYCVGWEGRVGKYHEDWLMRDQEQNAISVPDHWSWACINTGYGQFALEQIAELVDLYEVDGLFIDIFVDNFSTCFCPACDRLFQERQGYPMPRDLEKPENIAVVKRFQADYHEDFLKQVVRILKKRRPGALLTFNGVGGISAHTSRFSELVDWHSMESHAPNFLASSRTCKILRSQGKPFEITTPGVVQSIREGGSWLVEGLADWVSMIPKPASTLKIEAAVVLSNGGTLTVGLNPRADGSVNERESNPIQEAGRWIAERREVFADATSESDAAILWNEQSFVSTSLELEKRWGYLSGDHGLKGLHAGLLGNHTQFDIVREDQVSLENYQLIILPDEFVTDEPLEAKLREYVSGGGTLMVCYHASLADGMGGKRDNFGLADVMGLDCKGILPDSTTYVRPSYPDLARDLLSGPLMMRGEAIEMTLGTAKPLGTFVSPIAVRTPSHYIWTTAYNWPGEDSGKSAITVNRFGRGQCLYLGFPLGTNISRRGKSDPWPAQLLANIVDYLLPQPFLRTNAPHQVEVVANRWREGYAVHFISYYGGIEGHYCLGDRLPELGGLHLDIARARLPQRFSVRIAGREDDVPYRLEGDWLRIDLPPLTDHLALLLNPTA